jgi:tryptophanyl-tRNA synthetase
MEIIRKRILSGIRPTGPIHLGNYLGALTSWINLQDEYECFWMVADWHALMSEYKDSTGVKKYTREVIIDMIASGLDPEKSTIFVQSAIPEHAELNLILSCVTPLGWLERVPTYKEQIQELSSKDLTNYAFLGYPVLQAADIMLYKAELVPVGEDQLPHLEFTREIVRRFNSFFGEIFPEPVAKLTPVSKLVGIDGIRKMSKSYNNYILVSEEPHELRTKVMSMFTDPTRIYRSDPGHPDTCNVYTYHTIFGREGAERIRADCIEARIGCTDCKAELADRLEVFLRPIQQRRGQLLETPGKIEDIVAHGNEYARSIASQTMRLVRKAVFG